MIKSRQLLRKLLWILLSLIIFMIFAGLDWLPTVKGLNRLRREQRDEELRIINFAALASSFVFPDAEEKSLFAENNVLLRQALLQMDDDDKWLALALLELQAQIKRERIASARVFFTAQVLGTELGTAALGRSAELDYWLSLQVKNLRESFPITFDPSRYPWHGVFSGLEVIRKQRLASRELGVALSAPLPALLGFINRISRGYARLEIVRLHLEPGAALSRCWLICRGNYLVGKPSAWAVKEVAYNLDDDLLIDPDSELLWQKVSREMTPEVSR